MGLDNFFSTGMLVDYLLFHKLMSTNNDSQNKRFIIACNIGKMFYSKVESFSIVGSTIYGDSNNYDKQRCKPDVNSDLDLQVVNDSFFLPNSLFNNIKNLELINLFNNSKIDALAIHFSVCGVNVGIHFLKKNKYVELCNLDPITILLGRDSPAVHSHCLSGFTNLFESNEEVVIESFDKNLYKYNHDVFEKSDFVPKIYHRMILNSLFLFSSSEVLLARQGLVKKIVQFKNNFITSDLLNIFNPRLSDWSKFYKEFMLLEFEGGGFNESSSECNGGSTEQGENIACKTGFG